jgi:hypothetical protein
MADNHCTHGCYPVDKRWHGGSFVIAEGDIEDVLGVSPETLENRLGSDFYSGGDLAINDIFAFRRITEEFRGEVGEAMLSHATPAGEPYVRGEVEDDDEPVMEKISKRTISLSTVGQGPGMTAYLDAVDMLSTHYKFNPVIKVEDAFWASPESQVHQELVQRRQQAEQQINRTLGNLADLYQQKQLLEHDLRQLEARLGHVEEYEAAESEGYEGFEDELKADFVDLVDQHTGRHSILQMQANNVFPSITADFYSMTGLDDLREGHLADLPENEKAVLRKKWKLYEQWKEQFQTAVRSRYQDVQRRLNSVMTSIEQTEQWLKPYVQDIKMIADDFEPQLELAHGLSKYLPIGNANVYRGMKVIGAKDQSPGNEDGLYYDVMIMNATQGSLPTPENPQQAGGGLTLMSISFEEFLVCKHVYEAVFKEQMDKKKNEVEEYIQRYIGEEGPLVSDDELEERKQELRDRFGIGESDGNGGTAKGPLLGLGGSEDWAARVDAAQSMEELDRIEASLEWKKHRPSMLDRQVSGIKQFFGATDEFYHPDPSELRRELMGPGFPRQFYLDYKYSNDLYVMK